MWWLRFVGSLKLYVPFAKEPYKRDYILQKRPMILRNLLIVATPYVFALEASKGEQYCQQQKTSIYLHKAQYIRKKGLKSGAR